MGNLTAILDSRDTTVRAIFDYWKKRGDSEPLRTYLGASVLGEPCSRRLWYEFRWCTKEEFSGRMYRLFNRGEIEEPRIAADLRAIGCTVCDRDPATGEQIAVTFANGHGGGHLDGAVLGLPEAPKTWHVLEDKTHSAKSFRDLARRGLQQSKPKHYVQTQIYMRKVSLDRALYVAVNKDTEEIYVERIYLDKQFADDQMARALRIVQATEPPEKINDDPQSDDCKYCPSNVLCHGNSMGMALPVLMVSCRNCAYANPVDDGHWWCMDKDREISTEDQLAGCPNHMLIAGLISFAELIEFVDGHAVFMNAKDNSFWWHGNNKANGEFSSRELLHTPVSTLHGQSVERIRNLKARCEGSVVDGRDILKPEADAVQALRPSGRRGVVQGVGQGPADGKQDVQGVPPDEDAPF